MKAKTVRLSIGISHWLCTTTVDAAKVCDLLKAMQPVEEHYSPKLPGGYVCGPTNRRNYRHEVSIQNLRPEQVLTAAEMAKVLRKEIQQEAEDEAKVKAALENLKQTKAVVVPEPAAKGGAS